MNVRGHDGRFRPVPDYDETDDPTKICQGCWDPIETTSRGWRVCRCTTAHAIDCPGEGACTCGLDDAWHRASLRHVEGDAAQFGHRSSR